MQVHRHNNPILAGLAEPRLAATIVTDGFHLPKAAIAAIVYAKNRNAGVAVVSDAGYLAGLGAGR
jgi:N-acetylglucosamine-6-phosphate deacetylase